MKVKDLMSPEEYKKLDKNDSDSTFCGLCEIHERAYEKINGSVECPHCHKYFDAGFIDEENESKIVGETNTDYAPEENIESMVVAVCPECGGHVAFKPIPIIYNANHDVYYTGGKEYIPEKEAPKLNDKMKELIKNYTHRIKEGERLDERNLIIWLEYEMESALAKWLCDNGYKY